MYRMGIDLGGTTVKAGIVDESYRILASADAPTPPDAQSLIQCIVSLAEKLSAEARIPMKQVDALGLGVPGTANRKTGLMEYANNLSFENVPLPAMLRRRFGRPVAFSNDANAAAWGEFLAGCGRGSRSFVMVTLGTGIGGGIIIDGKLYEGRNYAAGEFGHFTIQWNGEPCSCGRRGCFETYASATALVRMAEQAMESAEGQNSLLWKSSCPRTGQSRTPALSGGAAVFAAAAAGDATASRVLEQYLSYLSIGIADLINIFQPEILCVGGGVSQAGDALMVPLRSLVEPQIYTRTSQVNTRIVRAALGNDAGIIGAAMLEAEGFQAPLRDSDG